MSQHVRVETRDAVLHVTLDRPEKKNALTVEMYAALAEAVRRADEDPAIRALLLTGAGDAFTAGNDLRDFLERPPSGESSPVHLFLNALVAARVPLVAAVQGLAVGIGTTMLLHFDLVYAGRSARFHLPFAQLGLVPEAGSSLLLPQRAGQARAAEMLLLGEPVGAEEALSMGLVSRLIEDGNLLEEAGTRAERLSRLPPEAVQATKALIRQADRQTVPERMRQEAEIFAQRLRSHEARAAMQRFFDSRRS